MQGWRVDVVVDQRSKLGSINVRNLTETVWDMQS